MGYPALGSQSITSQGQGSRSVPRPVLGSFCFPSHPCFTEGLPACPPPLPQPPTWWQWPHLDHTHTQKQQFHRSSILLSIFF